MKKISFIPFIGLVALLSSCSLFGGGKAPKFSKEGDEVKYEKFVELYVKAQEESEFSDTKSKLGDRTLKGTYYYSTSTSVKRGKKEISKGSSTTNKKEEMQFDYSNLVAKITSEEKETSKSTSPEGSESETDNTKTEKYYQFDKIDGTQYLVSANAKTQVYSKYTAAGEEKDKTFDYVAREELSSPMSYFTQYLQQYMRVEDFEKDTLWYVNDNLFTYVYNKEDKNTEDKYKLETNIKLKAQLDLTDGKQAVRLSYEVKAVMTLTDDYGEYKDGDVATSEQKVYADYSISSKDVNVKEVNLDDYSLSNGGGYIY